MTLLVEFLERSRGTETYIEESAGQNKVLDLAVLQSSPNQDFPHPIETNMKNDMLTRVFLLSEEPLPGCSTS